MINTLLSLPPRIARYLTGLPRDRMPASLPDALKSESVFIGHDPVNERLGSGGGTVNLLHQGWLKETGGEGDFLEWLEAERRLVIHAGGLSRRLPAYAEIGKALIPIPLREETPFARFQQTLIEFQMPLYQEMLRQSGSASRVLLASGDTWLDMNPLDIPESNADFTGIGMRTSPEMASHFGVFLVRRDKLHFNSAQQPLAFFLQKPEPELLYQLEEEYDFFVDTGLWMMSGKAIRAMSLRCAWEDSRQGFNTATRYPVALDFYADLCCEFGSEARQADSLGEPMTHSVIVVENPGFYHLGAGRQLFDSLNQLQQNRSRQRKRCYSSFTPQPYVSSVNQDNPVWLDTWLPRKFPGLQGLNILSSVPEVAELVALQSKQCLQCVPLESGLFAFKAYHIDDRFKGCPEDGNDTVVFGQTAHFWAGARGVEWPDNLDIFDLPLFPVLDVEEIDQDWLDFFFLESPDPTRVAEYQAKRKLSARQISEQIDCERLFSMKDDGLFGSLQSVVERMGQGYDPTLFTFDYQQMAGLTHRADGLWKDEFRQSMEAIASRIQQPVHAARFAGFAEILDVMERRANSQSNKGLKILRETILHSHRLRLTAPRPVLKEDQIVWARSPVRLDLAGGWSDTPPYCFEFGGSVLNVAVNLNGQPPIQVFVRPMKEREIRLRSIDLGVGETILTFEELDTFIDPNSGFSLPKAVLSLCGFHPDYSDHAAQYSSLAKLLEQMGGGVEISLLCAIPKGSGLGTSSILAATLLSAISESFGLGMDKIDVYRSVLLVEQLLTTGGGWQDQAGAIFSGIKLIETQPGYQQLPSVRYLPADSFGVDQLNRDILLYYTGVTRLAKTILQDIVSHMILRESTTIDLVHSIKSNALSLYESCQKMEKSEILRAIRRSWDFNKRLDSGTSNASIEGIIQRCGDHLAACKLLGAGGGGYLLLFARNIESGRRIRDLLEMNPPNDRARFIDIDLSETGIQVTTS